MAQKSVGVDVLPGLYSRGRGHSRKPVCATQAGKSRMHPYPDVRREGVFRFDADRDCGAGSSVRKEDSRERLAERPRELKTIWSLIGRLKRVRVSTSR